MKKRIKKTVKTDKKEKSEKIFNRPSETAKANSTFDSKVEALETECKKAADEVGKELEHFVEHKSYASFEQLNKVVKWRWQLFQYVIDSDKGGLTKHLRKVKDHVEKGNRNSFYASPHGISRSWRWMQSMQNRRSGSSLRALNHWPSNGER